jgi:large subunit ribosomal protein L6
MSRIGKLPVAIPEKVNVSVSAGTISVEGPKGKLSKTFNPTVVDLKVEDNAVTVSPVGNSRHSRAMFGTARSIVNGMVEGVTKGFEKNLTISGVGFRAAVNGNIVKLELGYSHDVLIEIPQGVTVTVADQTKVKVEGYDKQAVGELAAKMKKAYPVEPYKGKGVAITGEYVRRKEGKKGGK